jgi:hypothetical protein
MTKTEKPFRLGNSPEVQVDSHDCGGRVASNSNFGNYILAAHSRRMTKLFRVPKSPAAEEKPKPKPKPKKARKG